MKSLFIFITAFVLISCEKEYTCVCTSTITTQDSVVDHMRTTKLGSKGYRKTCTDKENSFVKNCQVR